MRTDIFKRRWLMRTDLTKLNISRNTVSWVFENVVIATTTIVWTNLMTLAK